MRLARKAADSIAAVLGSRVGKRGAKLYLFGSRAQDRLKGGDIDLLVLASAGLIRQLRREKYVLLAEIKERLGDQRIDLVLAATPAAREDPFIRRALSSAVLLRKWPARVSKSD